MPEIQFYCLSDRHIQSLFDVFDNQRWTGRWKRGRYVFGRSRRLRPRLFDGSLVEVAGFLGGTLKGQR